MTRIKNLHGRCQECGGPLEFLADHIGLEADCPHCGQRTELLLVAAPEEPAIPRRVLIWTGIAFLVLGLGLVGAMVALKRAEHWAARHKPAVAATAEDSVSNQPASEVQPEAAAGAPLGFTISQVSLEKASGSSLVYATGTVHNSESRQRFGLKLEVELLDGSGQKLGTAKDYQAVLEPGADWHFKALVVEPKGVVSARVGSLREEQ